MKNDNVSEIDWILTDNDIVHKIYQQGNKTSKECIQRLMTMDMPSSCSIFETEQHSRLDEYLKENKVKHINETFSSNVFIHFIRDVNKTSRPVNLKVESNNKINTIQIGKRSDRYLVGFFSDSHKKNTKEKLLLEEKAGIKLHKIAKDDPNDQKQKLLF